MSAQVMELRAQWAPVAGRDRRSAGNGSSAVRATMLLLLEVNAPRAELAGRREPQAQPPPAPFGGSRPASRARRLHGRSADSSQSIMVCPDSRSSRSRRAPISPCGPRPLSAKLQETAQLR